MKNQLKKITALLCAITMSVAALSACSTGEDESGSTAGSTKSESASLIDQIKARGTLVMATNAEFEPFEYKDENKYVGIDIEIAQAIADELGVELDILDIAFDSCIPALTSGRADMVIAGMSVTEDRLKNVDFSDAYFNASQAIVVTKDSDISSRADLDGKIIGVQQGTTGDTYVTDEDGKLDISVADVKRYSKGSEAVSDLISGRIDAVVIDNFPAEKFVERNSNSIVKLDEAMTEEEYAIALAKGESEFKDLVNSVIQSLKDSGKLDEIVSKYIESE